MTDPHLDDNSDENPPDLMVTRMGPGPDSLESRFDLEEDDDDDD